MPKPTPTLKLLHDAVFQLARLQGAGECDFGDFPAPRGAGQAAHCCFAAAVFWLHFFIGASLLVGTYVIVDLMQYILIFVNHDGVHHAQTKKRSRIV